MVSTIEIPCSGERVAAEVADRLTRRGFHIIRSFDLRLAASSGCNCPRHGASLCTCEYVVLLVYRASGAPAVVTAHGDRQHCQLGLVADANAPLDQKFAQEISGAVADVARLFANPSESSVTGI